MFCPLARIYFSKNPNPPLFDRMSDVFRFFESNARKYVSISNVCLFSSLWPWPELTSRSQLLTNDLCGTGFLSEEPNPTVSCPRDLIGLCEPCVDLQNPRWCCGVST